MRRTLNELFTNPDQNAREHNNPPVRVTPDILPDEFYVAADEAGTPYLARADIFESGYSTHVDGTGLWLPIVEYIASSYVQNITMTKSETDGGRFEVWNVSLKQTASESPATTDRP
ncbi:ATP-binding protein [Halobacterium jilantaiense]|uniref:Uncharacterized protein n=1 Tax=Halobacterium jilantaiense TaxID=355548 RepID=A0A1I0R371_9EURY|nr:hypothetical protein [Halobacterium jilantaiense]SEW34825.1 hypothetical protein SAMN04487945_3085 [Halobacterium jilantaiense]